MLHGLQITDATFAFEDVKSGTGCKYTLEPDADQTDSRQSVDAVKLYQAVCVCVCVCVKFTV